MTSSLLFAVFVDQIHQLFAEDALILLPHGLDGLLERGLVGTALDTLVNLCKILNVSSDSLLFGVDETPELSNILYKISSLSNEELEILDRGIDLLLIAIHYEDMKKE